MNTFTALNLQGYFFCKFPKIGVFSEKKPILYYAVNKFFLIFLRFIHSFIHSFLLDYLFLQNIWVRNIFFPILVKATTLLVRWIPKQRVGSRLLGELSACSSFCSSALPWPKDSLQSLRPWPLLYSDRRSGRLLEAERR